MSEPTIEPMTDAERARVIKIRMSHRQADDGDEGCSVCFLARMLDRAEERLDQAEARGAWRPTHRHVKRGSVYEVVGTATIQTDQLLTDNARVVVYRGEHGDLWARREAEFGDGRFDPLPTPPRAGGPDVSGLTEAAEHQALQEMGRGAILCRSTDGDMIWTHRREPLKAMGLMFSEREIDVPSMLARGLIVEEPCDPEMDRGNRWVITPAGRAALDAAGGGG